MNTLIDLIQNAKEGKRGICFIQQDGTEKYFSYSDLYEQAQNQLQILRQYGVKRGQELIFQIQDEKEFIVTFWACILGGIIAAPLPVFKNDQQIQMLNSIVTKLESSKIYVSNSLQKDLNCVLSTLKSDSMVIHERILQNGNIEDSDKELVQINPDTTAMIQFSSGSTGIPKGIELTHANIVANVEAMMKALELSDSDKCLSWMPLTHNFGLIGFHITPLVCSMDQVMMPTDLFLINPLKWLKVITDKGITITASPNFGYMHCMNALKACKNAEFDLSSVRIILNGAEPVNDQVCKTFLDKLSVFHLRNNSILPAYGMAEAGLAVTISELDKPYHNFELDREHLTIGSKIMQSNNDEICCTIVETGIPVENTQIRIVHEKGNLLVDGETGHIHLKSPSIMKGYYNSPEENSKIFTEDGWLRTGDVGFLYDNRLYITGRAKEIIFINGKNYYPHDFELLIQKVPHSEKMVVSVASKFSESIQTEIIIVFVETDLDEQNFECLANNIKKYVNANTGIEINHIIHVPKMPRTGSGKIQKFELLKQYSKKDDTVEEVSCISDNVYLQEENDVKHILYKIFSNVLNRQEIHETDEFSDLGMNSLKAGLIVSQINQTLGINLKLSVFFQCKSIKSLEDEVRKMKTQSYETIKKASIKEYYPLSSQQKRLYAIHQIEPDSINYNIFNAVRIYGKLNRHLVTKSFEVIISRHEALRTSFELVENQLVQIIHDTVESSVKFIKMSREQADEFTKSFVKPFQLNMAPLMRVVIIEVSEDEDLLLMDIHHIISDGMSMGYIIKEFCELYNGNNLPKVKMQYKDYAVWQQEQFNNNGFKKQEEYWSSHFEDTLPVLDLPLDNERKNIQSFNGDRVKLSFDNSLSDKIYHFASNHGVTLYMLLMGACSILLSKYTMQEDILIGSPISGRSHPDFNGTVGMFVNTVVIRNKPQPNKRFLDYLAEIKDNVYNAYENQDYQFEWLTKDLNIRKTPGRNPMFDIMFNMQNMNLPEMELNDLQCVPYSLEDKATRFDLILVIHEEQSGIIIEFVYCTDLFKRNTIENMEKHFSNIMNQIVSDGTQQIKEITILSKQKDKSFNLPKRQGILKMDFNF